MSVGKISKTVGVGIEAFEGLTLEQIKQKIIAEFHTTYGRYENVSGNMIIEVCHAKDVTTDESKAHWVKYEDGKIIEDEVMTREKCIPLLLHAMSIGYRREAEGVTQDDIERERIKKDALKSTIDREGLLGVYRKGQDFLSVREYSKDLYTISSGYGECMLECLTDQTDTQARERIMNAELEGFRKDGKVYDDFAPANPLMSIFDKPEETGSFNPDWFKKK